MPLGSFALVDGLEPQLLHELPEALPAALKVPSAWWPSPLNCQKPEVLGNGSLLFPCISPRPGRYWALGDAAGSLGHRQQSA